MLSSSAVAVAAVAPTSRTTPVPVAALAACWSTTRSSFLRGHTRLPLALAALGEVALRTATLPVMEVTVFLEALSLLVVDEVDRVALLLRRRTVSGAEAAAGSTLERSLERLGRTGKVTLAVALVAAPTLPQPVVEEALAVSA